jgi:hypothetical protein
MPEQRKKEESLKAFLLAKFFLAGDFSNSRQQ